jgi:hypothetical protein
MSTLKVTVSVLALSTAAFAGNTDAPLKNGFRTPIVAAFSPHQAEAQSLLEFLNISSYYSHNNAHDADPAAKYKTVNGISPIYINNFSHAKTTQMMSAKTAGLLTRDLSVASYYESGIDNNHRRAVRTLEHDARQTSRNDGSLIADFSADPSSQRPRNNALENYRSKPLDQMAPAGLNDAAASTTAAISSRDTLLNASLNNIQSIFTFQANKKAQVQPSAKASPMTEVKDAEDKDLKGATDQSSPFSLYKETAPESTLAASAKDATPFANTVPDAPTPPPAPDMVENHRAAKPHSLADFIKTLKSNPQAGLRHSTPGTLDDQNTGIPAGLSLSKDDALKLHTILMKRAASLEDHSTTSMGTKPVAKKADIKSAAEMGEAQDRSSLLAAIRNFSKTRMKKTNLSPQKTAPQVDFKLQAGELVEELKKGVKLRTTASTPKPANTPEIAVLKSVNELDQELRQAKLSRANSLKILETEKQLALAQQNEKGSQLLTRIRLRATQTINQQQVKASPPAQATPTTRVHAALATEQNLMPAVVKAATQPELETTHNTSVENNTSVSTLASLTTGNEPTDATTSENLIDVFKKAASKFDHLVEKAETTISLDADAIRTALRENKAEIGLSSADLEKLRLYPRQAFDSLVDEFYNQDDNTWNFSFAEATAIMSRFKNLEEPEVTTAPAPKKVGRLSINNNTGFDFLSAIQAQKGLMQEGEAVDTLKIEEVLAAEKARKAAPTIEDEPAQLPVPAPAPKVEALEDASMPNVVNILNKRRSAMILDDEDEDEDFDF